MKEVEGKKNPETWTSRCQVGMVVLPLNGRFNSNTSQCKSMPATL
jgi:hypothetical protein